MKLPEIKRPSKEVLGKIQSLKEERGMIVAIEPDTSDFFVGKDVIEALKKARAKYPKAFFYFVRVGYPSAHAHKGGIRRI